MRILRPRKGGGSLPKVTLASWSPAHWLSTASDPPSPWTLASVDQMACDILNLKISFPESRGLSKFIYIFCAFSVFLFLCLGRINPCFWADLPLWVSLLRSLSSWLCIWNPGLCADGSPGYIGSLSRMAVQVVEKWKIESSAFWRRLSFPRVLKSRLILFSHCPFSLGSDLDVSYRKNSAELSVIGDLEEAMETGCATWRYSTMWESQSPHVPEQKLGRFWAHVLYSHLSCKVGLINWLSTKCLLRIYFVLAPLKAGDTKRNLTQTLT